MSPRTNVQWLEDLRAGGPRREAALADLRRICLAGLPYALRGWLPSDEPRFSALAEDVVQDTLLRVVDRLDTFEGRSQFTTWVNKIAVRLALTELRRRRWQEVPLEAGNPPWRPQSIAADPAVGPERAAEQADMLAYLQRLIVEELTDRQRRAITEILTTRLPMDERARRLGIDRNALYKLVHDARLRLKRRVELDGLSPGQILAIFERP